MGYTEIKRTAVNIWKGETTMDMTGTGLKNTGTGSVKLSEIVEEFGLEILHKPQNYDKITLTKMDVYRLG